MSHQYQLTDHNEFSYTACCTHTQHLQLGFGNIALQMKSHEFTRLLAQVEDTFRQCVGSDACPNCRNIIIETSVKNMAFTFSLYELEMLLEVMQRTEMLLEAKSIISQTK